MNLRSLLSFRRVDTAARPIGSSGSWFPIGQIDRPPGAWQRDEGYRPESVTSFYAVYSCMTLIANDIGKCRPRLMLASDEAIWGETSAPAFSPVLRKQNGYQNWIQFQQWWTMSKLANGNAYALKQRDDREVVVALYVLDPALVQPLVSPSGEVFYRLREDNLSGVRNEIAVPASEIIHDRMNCISHPLIGTSPLYAAYGAAAQGLAIQRDSSSFFANGSNPGGVITAPAKIDDPTAKRIKDYWDANFGRGGAEKGKVAVLGDSMKFEAMRMTSVDSQLIEQLSLTGKMICSAFHVPPFKIGIGEVPVGQKVRDLNQIYYDDCLGSLIAEYEQTLGDGLSLPPKYRIDLDTDELLRMDEASLVETLAKAVGGAIAAPNEARKRMNLPSVTGGNTVYLQQQNYSLEALAKRDQGQDPFGGPVASPQPAANDPQMAQEAAKNMEQMVRRVMEESEERRKNDEAERRSQVEATEQWKAAMKAEHESKEADLLKVQIVAAETAAENERLERELQSERDARAAIATKQAEAEVETHDFMQRLTKTFSDA